MQCERTVVNYSTSIISVRDVLLTFLENLFKILQKFLHEAPYNIEEIGDILGEKLSTIMKSSPTSLAVLAAATQFKLYQVRFFIFAHLSLLEAFLRTLLILHVTWLD